MRRIRPAIVVAILCVVATLLAPARVRGQSAQSASLVGRVTDESGGAMPGVTVTARSPALQVPQLTAVTGVDGDYRLLELPPGVYRVAFELSGFQSTVRTDVHLTTGSAGRPAATRSGASAKASGSRSSTEIWAANSWRVSATVRPMGPSTEIGVQPSARASPGTSPGEGRKPTTPQ